MKRYVDFAAEARIVTRRDMARAVDFLNLQQIIYEFRNFIGSDAKSAILYA